MSGIEFPEIKTERFFLRVVLFYRIDGIFYRAIDMDRAGMRELRAKIAIGSLGSKG